MPFLTEDKRKNLVKAGTVYLFAAGTVLKLADTLLSGLDLSSWVMRSVAAVLVAGLPVALYRAWKRGDELESQSAEGRSPTPSRRDAPERSIAVLPFVNMSADAEQEFFSDGLSEELLNLLAKLPELQVASRTSAFSFKGESVDIPTVAEKLNVRYVLEGSVRKGGSQVRITAQLIRAADDVHEWSETYDRELDDIFAIQDEIGAAVVDALKVTLLGADPPVVAETDPEAYALYLKARHFYHLHDEDGLLRADETLNEVFAITSDYAPAWNLKGMIASRFADIGARPWDEGYRAARAAIENALELNPELAEAHASLGWIEFMGVRDLRAAARHTLEAIRLNPGDGEVLADAVLLALALNRPEVAVALGERALVRDPVNIRTHRYLAAAYGFADRPEAAADSYRQALALSPGYIGGHFHLGRTLLAMGEREAALATVAQEAHPGFKLTGLAIVHHALGNRTESDAAVAELHADWASEAAYQIAEVHSLRGELDVAFEWLGASIANNDPGVATMCVDTLLRPLHGDPRWPELRTKAGLSEEVLNTIEFDVTSAWETAVEPPARASIGRKVAQRSEVATGH